MEEIGAIKLLQFVFALCLTLFVVGVMVETNASYVLWTPFVWSPLLSPLRLLLSFEYLDICKVITQVMLCELVYCWVA